MSILVSRARTRTRWRETFRSTSVERAGSSLASYVPSRLMIRSTSSGDTSTPPCCGTPAHRVLHEQFPGPVRGPDEGPRGDVEEAHRFRLLAAGLERLQLAHPRGGDGPGARRGVRAGGEDTPVVPREAPHRPPALPPRLPEAEH